jgi:hypothetical protein
MLAVCVIPFVLVVIAADHRMSVTVIGGKDAGFDFDYGAVLCEAPGALATALLAPLVGYRRRVALWLLVPPVGIYYAWVIGFLAGELGERAQAGARKSPSERHVDSGKSAAFARPAEDLIREGLKR